MKEKTDRNQEIINDKKTMSWSQLMAKWGLSYATLRRILLRTPIEQRVDKRTKAYRDTKKQEQNIE